MNSTMSGLGDSARDRAKETGVNFLGLPAKKNSSKLISVMNYDGNKADLSEVQSSRGDIRKPNAFGRRH